MVVFSRTGDCLLRVHKECEVWSNNWTSLTILQPRSHNTAVLMVIIAIKCGLCLSLAPDKSLVLGIGLLMHDFNLKNRCESHGKV